MCFTIQHPGKKPKSGNDPSTPNGQALRDGANWRLQSEQNKWFKIEERDGTLKKKITKPEKTGLFLEDACRLDGAEGRH